MTRRNRTSRRRRSFHGEGRLSYWIGGGLLAFVFFAILAAAYFYFITVSSSPNRDAQTFCPENGPSSKTVILIDTTDQISAIQKVDLLNQLEALIEAVPRDGAVEMYSVGPIQPVAPDPLFEKCNPGRGSEIAEWTGNPTMVENQWQTGFRSPLDRVLTAMLEASEAPSSPILESIQWATINALASPKYEGKPKTLVIVSDMLQHTDELSFYRAVPDFDEFASTPIYRQLNAPLENVSVRILLLQRPETSTTTDKAIVEFWTRYFDKQRAVELRILRLAVQ